jgi:hypothetical protein
LGEEEFWGLTLAQFDALTERYHQRRERADYRAAIICSHIYNSVPHKDKPALQVWNIFPEYNWQPEQEPLTIDQMIIRNAAMGGILVELN